MTQSTKHFAGQMLPHTAGAYVDYIYWTDDGKVVSISSDRTGIENLVSSHGSAKEAEKAAKKLAIVAAH